jgi:signal transduction histidine kinase
MPIANRRKATNYVQNRGALLRLSIPFILLLSLSAGLLLIVQSQVVSALGYEGAIDPALIANLQQVVSQVTMTSLIGLSISACLCYILYIIVSHRIFGPMVPIRRHVESLKKGDFTSRVNLRSYDEFKDLAADLNALAEVLQEKSATH